MASDLLISLLPPSKMRNNISHYTKMDLRRGEERRYFSDVAEEIKFMTQMALKEKKIPN